MSPSRGQRRAGYTLIEIMVVVAIIGLLASIAVPAFIGQMMRSRTTEAISTIGAIREAQDAYYATFSRFCGPLAWNPATYAAAGSQSTFDPSAPGWVQLGADPEGPVRFRYQVLAGQAGTRPAGIPGFSGADPWYVVQAEADLDGNGQSMAVEGYSIGNRVFISRGIGGPHLARGWE